VIFIIFLTKSHTVATELTDCGYETLSGPTCRGSFARRCRACSNLGWSASKSWSCLACSPGIVHVWFCHIYSIIARY